MVVRAFDGQPGLGGDVTPPTVFCVAQIKLCGLAMGPVAKDRI